MSLTQDIQNQLTQAASSVPYALDVPTADGRLRSQLTQVDRIGCTFQHVTFETDRLAQATSEQLKELGQRVASRLQYLLEPIGLSEVDDQSCVVQLRSNPPSKDDDGTSYYELLVRRGGSLSLCRYRKIPGQPRQAIDAQVTCEVFQRLARDLATP